MQAAARPRLLSVFQDSDYNSLSQLQRGVAPILGEYFKMAKKSADGPSKSQIIKDYFKTNPGAMPKDVVAKIKKESGVDVSIALVSNVKHNMKKGGKSKS